MNAVFVDTGGWMACADERARHLFFQYRDKELSFTDCTNIAVMRELKLTEVITTDGHFQQAGFHVLPPARVRKARKPRRS